MAAQNGVGVRKVSELWTVIWNFNSKLMNECERLRLIRAWPSLQELDHVGTRRLGHVGQALLHHHLERDAVLQRHRVPQALGTRPGAIVKIHPQHTSQSTVHVCGEYHVLGPLGRVGAPPSHGGRVASRHANDLVHTLLPQRVHLLQVARHVLGRAHRAPVRDAKQGGQLARKQLRQSCLSAVHVELDVPAGADREVAAPVQADIARGLGKIGVDVALGDVVVF
mmetsp:Transcript_13061/g.37625  ORF Transcript_13061/g.37625 Transcript_13061/m.37625 type:complete len:224 (+) Transcript_13061:3464-4135(+)